MASSYAEKMESYGEKIKATVDVMVAYAISKAGGAAGANGSGAAAAAAATPAALKTAKTAKTPAAAVAAAAAAAEPKAKRPTTCPGGPMLYNEFIKEVNERIVEKRENGKQAKYQPLKMKATKFWSAVKKEACTSGGLPYVREQARRAADLILRGYSSYNKTTPKAKLLNTNFETRKARKVPPAAANLRTAAPAAAAAAAAGNNNGAGAFVAAGNNLAGLPLPGQRVRTAKTKKNKRVKIKTPSMGTAVAPGANGLNGLNENAALAALAELEGEAAGATSARLAAEAAGTTSPRAASARLAAEAENSPNRRVNLAAAAAEAENRGRAALAEAVNEGLSTARSPAAATPTTGANRNNSSAYGYTNLGNYNENTGLRRIKAKNGVEYFMNDEHGLYNINGAAPRGTLKPGGNINYV